MRGSGARAAIRRHNAGMPLAAGDTFTLDLALLASVALCAVGCAVGSVVRDRVVHAFRTRAGRADLGVLAVNLAACVVVGLASQLGGARGDLRDHLPGDLLRDLLVLGLAGGLSTWSTLAVEVAGALRARQWSLVALHVPGAGALALAAYLAARALAGGAA